MRNLTRLKNRQEQAALKSGMIGDRECSRVLIVGTTITVADIAKIFHQRTPDEIANDYDLTLPQVSVLSGNG